MSRPAGGHVGGHQGGQLAVAEVLQGPLAVGLAQVAVDGVGSDPLLAQLLDQPVGAPLGAHEDQGLLRVATDGGAHLDPVHLVHLEEPVLHGVDGGAGRGHLVQHRIGQVAAHQPVDGAVEGGREQQRLVLPLETPEHPLDLGHEPHVGHAVGLVEDQGLDVGHRQLAPVAEVDEPAGRGDDHVDPAAELLHLPLDVRPAVDGGDPQPRLLGQWLEDLADLHGQLTGGDQHQGAGTARLGGPGRHGALEERDAEGQRLARSGLGLAAHVPPGQGVGHGHRLDGEGGGDPLGGEGLDQGRIDAQRGEGRGIAGEAVVRRRAASGRRNRRRDPTDRSRLSWGAEAHSRLFGDGRRPTVDTRASHECLRARLGPSFRHASADRRTEMRKTPVEGTVPTTATQCTRGMPVDTRSNAAAGRSDQVVEGSR